MFDGLFIYGCLKLLSTFEGIEIFGVGILVLLTVICW